MGRDPPLPGLPHPDGGHGAYDTEIDYCPTCRGVWLDRGELEKLMTREATWRSADDSDDGSGPRRTYPPPGPHPPPGAYPPKKKEGFFSRLFDFD